MSHGRSRLAAAAALLAAAVAGCGLGEGETTAGEASLTVTRDYGTEVLAEATVTDPPEAETVIRFLDREAEITTRYGGGFVQSIEGLSGGISDGRSFDWFFYVDGIESPVGSADREVRAGHRIWWDHRDWTDAMRVPAVVGSWPEPFLQAAEDEPAPVAVECHGGGDACEAAASALAGHDVDASVVDPGEADPQAGPRMLVGPWAELRDDPAAAQLERGPQTSGVFARMRAAGGAHELVGLDERGATAAELGPDAGLVAALRQGERPPTWVVTGGGAEGVASAARLLDGEALADRYALAVDASGDEVALPVGEGG